MFPSQGCCHGVFLLGYTAKLKERHSFDEWVQAACERSTIMSKALDLNHIAKSMLGLNIVTLQDHVKLAGTLEAVSDQADKYTLQAIARLLLKASPPSWLWFAVRDGHVVREYIPTGDLANLAWMDPDLDAILIDVYEAISKREENDFRKAIGDAAELFVIAALRHAGVKPLHVSRLSDSYGYDIECREASVDRIEVKAASQASQASFHISRNEFEKSSCHGQEWRLIQVVFSSQAFVSEKLHSFHIVSIRQLRHGTLQELVPADTSSFKWSESAQIAPPTDAWEPANLSLDPNFSTAGFKHGRSSETPY